MNITINDLAQLAAKAASEKKAIDTVILDIRDLSLIADYFVICSANSETQVQAIAREIKEKVIEAGVEIKGMEGLSHARWVLIDLGDVVVHVFHKEEREFYNLERLWNNAPRVNYKEIE
ncbi:MAG: ribosome silencing factor [Vulcanibacillus sp.]